MDRDEIFKMLCQLSDRQFDSSLKPRVLALVGRPNEDIKDELLQIIDDCINGALCSDFEIKVLNVVWLCCGGTDEELLNRNRN